MDYFTLFSLPPQFSLDVPDLTRRYFTLQQQFHPDRFAHQPEAERVAALQKSMELNEAYATLKSPLKRAEYLLRLVDITVGTEKDSVKPEHALLLENLENREQLMEAKGLEEIKRLELLAEAQKKDALEQFDCYYRNNEFNPAAQQVIRARYALKFAEEAKAKRMRKQS
jgi:molecular chaperone HscB